MAILLAANIQARFVGRLEVNVLLYDPCRFNVLVPANMLRYFLSQILPIASFCSTLAMAAAKRGKRVSCI